jgi:hypothetical protein
MQDCLLRVKPQFISGMVPQHGDVPPLNAVSILPTMDQGLHQSSSKFTLPETVGQAKYLVSEIHHTVPPRNGPASFQAPRFVTVCSPLGSISDLHINTLGMGMIIFPVSGQKLWLLWEPAPPNLAWITEHNDDSCQPDILSMLKNLLHLKVFTYGTRHMDHPETWHHPCCHHPQHHFPYLPR